MSGKEGRAWYLLICSTGSISPPSTPPPCTPLSRTPTRLCKEGSTCWECREQTHRRSTSLEPAVGQNVFPFTVAPLLVCWLQISLMAIKASFPDVSPLKSLNLTWPISSPTQGFPQGHWGAGARVGSPKT